MPRRQHSPVARVLADLAAPLDRLGIEWSLFGAQAAILRGLRRTTVDVDVTAVGEQLDGETVWRACHDAFDLRVPDAREFARTTRVLPLTHRFTAVQREPPGRSACPRFSRPMSDAPPRMLARS